MARLVETRAYLSDLPDHELADALHKRLWPDLPRAEFDEKCEDGWVDLRELAAALDYCALMAARDLARAKARVRAATDERTRAAEHGRPVTNETPGVRRLN